jgi:hypothetical protein
MRGTIVRIGAAGAGALLTLGLFAASPAGATGSTRQSKGEQSKGDRSESKGDRSGSKGDRSGSKGDRSESKGERSGKVSCFNTEGRTQGRSHSDPDGMSNGGADKPGCTGGFDADRDGNNGCGNDADREDDNNGNCGRKKAQRPSNAGAEKERGDKAKKERGDDTKVKAARVKAEKVDADIKIRCQGHDRDTTPPAGSTDVAAAGTANGCSCPKDSEDTAVLGATDVRVQAAGSVPDSALLAAEASTTTTTTAPTTVLGASVTAPAAAETPTSTTPPDTQVLGETLSAPDTLARTGAGIGGLALLGGLFFGGGRLIVLARRFLRIG